MRFLYFIFACLLLHPYPLLAVEKTRTTSAYQQDMIELGSYVFGLNQERTKKNPDSDNIRFLSDSMLKVVDRLGGDKDKDGFHDNFKELRGKIKDLKNAKGSDEILKQAGEVVNACGNCHTNKGVSQQKGDQ